MSYLFLLSFELLYLFFLSTYFPTLNQSNQDYIMLGFSKSKKTKKAQLGIQLPLLYPFEQENGFIIVFYTPIGKKFIKLLQCIMKGPFPFFFLSLPSPSQFLMSHILPHQNAQRNGRYPKRSGRCS